MGSEALGDPHGSFGGYRAVHRHDHGLGHLRLLCCHDNLSMARADHEDREEGRAKSPQCLGTPLLLLEPAGLFAQHDPVQDGCSIGRVVCGPFGIVRADLRVRGGARQERHEPVDQQLERVSPIVSGELLELAPRDHAAPVREIVDLFHLEAHVRVRADHVQLLAFGAVPVDGSIVVRVGDRYHVGAPASWQPIRPTTSLLQDLLDLGGVQLSEHQSPSSGSRRGR